MMDFRNIGTLFGQAALNPQLWMAALDALAGATRSYRGQLIGIGGPRTVPFNWATHLDDSATRHFVAISGGDPAVNFRVAAGNESTVGEVICERTYASHRARIGDGSYESFCRDADMPFGCQTIIARDSDRMIGLALLRSRTDGVTTPTHRGLFAQIIPHVTAAVHLQTAIEDRGSALILGALDSITVPALLIDAFGRVTASTPAADEALRTLPHVDVAGGAIVCSSQRSQALINTGLARVLGGVVPAVDLLLHDGRAALRLSIHRLDATEWSLGFVPRAILVLRPRRLFTETTAALMRATYGLTIAEAEIALSLGCGVARDEIARQRNTTIGTVRQQVKAIFAKLEINREAELPALLATIEA